MSTTEGTFSFGQDAGIEVLGDAHLIVRGSDRPWWPVVAGLVAGLSIAVIERRQWMAQRGERAA